MGESVRGRGIPWSDAWATASLGPNGFWRTHEPSAHFRTPVGPELAEALTVILAGIDDRLGRPERIEVVDVGAGDGSLLAHIRDHIAGTSLGDRCRLTGVDLRERALVTDGIDWVAGAAPQCLSDAFPDGVNGLIIACEWLDEIPCDVVEVDEGGRPRYVNVDPVTGVESPGDVVDPSSPDARWLELWWPQREPGTSAEIGRPRDEAWAALCGFLNAGTALAIDYAAEPRSSTGSLRAYREGRRAEPVPDGTCNITASVLLESCAAATHPHGTITDQRTALRDLGFGLELPVPSNGEAYARELERISHLQTLTDPAGMGRFGWLRYDKA